MNEPNEMIQCPRCCGRGYLPEYRKPSKLNPNGLGFYARNCPRCGGSGQCEARKARKARAATGAK